MSSRIVQFSKLGNFGRFGNQLFQYVFARAYAEKYDATLEVPAWIGEKIFENVSHPPISRPLPIVGLDRIEWGRVNIDLYGYFQTSEFFSFLSEKKIREWLVLKKCWKDRYTECSEIAAHERVGDFKSMWPDVFCQVSRESYINHVNKLGLDERKIEWVSEENPTIDPDLSSVSYRNTPGCMYGGGVYDDNGISFLPDFFKLINSRILLRSNSTFGFWAGFFNSGQVYSPVVSSMTGLQTVEFENGNAAAVCRVTNDIIFGE